MRWRRLGARVATRSRPVRDVPARRRHASRVRSTRTAAGKGAHSRSRRPCNRLRAPCAPRRCRASVGQRAPFLGSLGCWGKSGRGCTSRRAVWSSPLTRTSSACFRAGQAACDGLQAMRQGGRDPDHERAAPWASGPGRLRKVYNREVGLVADAGQTGSTDVNTHARRSPH